MWNSRSPPAPTLFYSTNALPPKPMPAKPVALHLSSPSSGRKESIVDREFDDDASTAVHISFRFASDKSGADSRRSIGSSKSSPRRRKARAFQATPKEKREASAAERVGEESGDSPAGLGGSAPLPQAETIATTNSSTSASPSARLKREHGR